MTDKTFVEGFSKKLRETREAAGLRQADVAKLVGLSEESYARLERGSSLPRLETFFAVSRVLSLKVEDFTDLKTEKTEQAEEGEADSSGTQESADFRRLLRAARKLDARELNLMAQIAETFGKPKQDGG